jgi:hypothetical protein
MIKTKKLVPNTRLGVKYQIISLEFIFILVHFRTLPRIHYHSFTIWMKTTQIQNGQFVVTPQMVSMLPYFIMKKIMVKLEK